MNLLKALVIVITAGAAFLGVELTEHVHSARWNVKTLGDGYIFTSPPIPTTIEEQAALPTPDVGETVSRLPSERTLYTLTAELMEVRKEFDGDYHLILEDPVTHLRMIAEIPDTTSKTPATYRANFAHARATINRVLGKTPGFLGGELKSPMTVKISGVGFFDEPHIFSPKGTAPNDREIHPVLSIEPVFTSALKN